MFFSLGLHVESSPVYRHSSKYSLCKVSPFGFRIRAVILSVKRFLHRVLQVLVRHHCSMLAVKSFFPRVNNFSIVTTNACCPFRQARVVFTTADGKVTEFARCCPLGPSRCFPIMFVVSRKFFSSCHFCDRHAGGWQLCRKPRVLSFSVFSIGSARVDMCPVVSGNLCVMSLQAMLKCEDPAVFVKLFFTLSSFPCICTVFDHIFGIRLGALEMCYILVC